MMGGVKRHLGIMKSVQSDKGGSTGQIAGVIAFANMWFLNLANLGKQKVHPFVGFLQFLLVLLVGVEFYSKYIRWVLSKLSDTHSLRLLPIILRMIK